MGTPSPGSSHDIVLQNSSGSPYGYMTYPNTSHRGVVDAFRKAIGGSDNPRYQDMSTVKIHAQTDWHSGHGKTVQGEGTYFYGNNINTRPSNKLSVSTGVTNQPASFSSTESQFKWIKPFVNPNNIHSIAAITEDGKVYGRAYGSTSFSLIKSLGAYPSDVEIFSTGSPSRNVLAIGFDGASPGWFTSYPNTAASYVQTTDGVLWGKMANHRGLLYTAINVLGYRGIYANTVATGYGMFFIKAVGNENNKFTSLHSGQNALLIGKEDGLWCISDTDADSIVPYQVIDMSSNRSLDNFTYMIDIDGKIVVSCDRDIYEITGSFEPTYNRTITAIGPFHKKQLPKSYYGKVTGFSKNISDLITSIDAGASGHSCIYLNNGAGWSNIYSTASFGLNGMNRIDYITCLSDLTGSPWYTEPTLMFGYTDIDTPVMQIRAIPVYDTDGDSYSLYSGTFNTSGDIVMLFDGELPTVVKWIDKLTLFGNNPTAKTGDATTNIVVQYVLDPDIEHMEWVSWTTLSTITSTGRLESNTLSFPAGTTCKRMAIKINLLNNAILSRPAVIEGMTIHYLPRPDQNKAYRYSLNVWREGDQRPLSGVETMDMQERADALFSMHAAQVPVILYRSDGNASPPNVTGHRVVISDIDEAEVIPNRKTSNTHPRGLRTNVTFIEV